VKARQHFTDGKPYILHFATGDPRDNTSTALAAFSQAAPHLGQDMMLLLVGSGAQAIIEKGVTRYGLACRARHAGFLSDDELVLAFHGAEAYLDPTLYEGFGLQLLEAMACGVPVLSSLVTSVPEVVGKAGMLFDPYDVDGFALGLVSVVKQPEIRMTMASRGYERAKQFSWDRTIKQLEETLETIVRRNGN
jgi:glycosyltransferase involved in cell wall biosynthesis